MLRSSVRFADGHVKSLVHRVFALVFFHQPLLLLLPQENPLLACQPSTEVVLGTFSHVAAVVLPFELGSGVPELLPIPFDMGAAELIGGIIPIEYIAIRLGSLNIFGSMPMLARTLGSIPIMLAIIFGSG